MERNSFIFYRSFFEAAQELNQRDRVKFYDAVCELALNENETELKGPAKAVLISVKPQIEANNIRYTNGSKGGRKKGSKTETKTEPKQNQNETKVIPNEECRMKNENEECRMKNENENELPSNENSIKTHMQSLYETEFRRELTKEESIQLTAMVSYYGDELVEYALREAVIYEHVEFAYIVSVLKKWKANGFTAEMYKNGMA